MAALQPTAFARPLLAIALLAALAGCATTSTTAPVAPTPPPALVVDTAPANDNLNAVLWQQGSVEYRLIAGQTWRNALAQLDRAIKSPDWDALPKDSRDAGSVRGLPHAVIVDIDETVLDNSIYQARLIANGTSYDEATWDAWVREQAAAPVPGALEFAKAAAARGVTVFYVTNRAEHLGEATLANLRALGFPIAQPGQFLGLGTVVDDCESDGSEKSCRRRLVGRTHRVLLQVGDQLGDFVEIQANTPAGREQAVRPYLAWVGERWFVLPNPTYGSWEPALFDNNWRQPEADRRAAKRAALRIGNPPPPTDE